jgi:hypothetical protein
VHETAKENAMAQIIAHTPKVLALQSGSTTLTLDKDSGRATLQRKLLLWSRKPQEAPLSELQDVAVGAAVDRASGVELCVTMLRSNTGAAWALPAANKDDAEKTAATLREFLGLAA